MKEGCKFDATGSRRARTGLRSRRERGGKASSAQHKGALLSPREEQCVGGCLFIGEVSTGREFWGIDASLAGQECQTRKCWGVPLRRRAGKCWVRGQGKGHVALPCPSRRLVKPHWASAAWHAGGAHSRPDRAAGRPRQRQPSGGAATELQRLSGSRRSIRASSGGDGFHNSSFRWTADACVSRSSTCRCSEAGGRGSEARARQRPRRAGW